MKITTVLFDLDGTLLPMDQDAFVKVYFGLLAEKLAPHGYDHKELIKEIWAGIKAMVKNTGETPNENIFWDSFISYYGEGAKNDIPIFDAFYRNDFIGAKQACGFNPLAADAVNLCKGLGLRVVLATNPIFPATATEQRISWAGFKPADFEFYSTYENFNFCKPNPDYYIEITRRLNVKPEECLMIGNDVDEDMVAGTLGMKVFLLTDCLINKHGKDISNFPNGNFVDLKKFIEKIVAE